MIRRAADILLQPCLAFSDYFFSSSGVMLVGDERTEADGLHEAEDDAGEPHCYRLDGFSAIQLYRSAAAHPRAYIRQRRLNMPTNTISQ